MTKDATDGQAAAAHRGQHVVVVSAYGSPCQPAIKLKLQASSEYICGEEEAKRY